MSTQQGRPEFVRCIQHTHADLTQKTWCGLPREGFVFQSVDHAVYAAPTSRMVPCPKCVEKVNLALNGYPQEDF